MCQFHGNFLLFDLEGASLTTLGPSQYNRHLTEFEPVATLSIFADAISQPYFFQHSTRISVLTRYGARGLVIPHSTDSSRDAIEVIRLLSSKALDTQYASIGYDRALICSWPEFITLQYAWPEDIPRALLAEKVVDLNTSEGPREGRWPRVLFDHSSGRILLSVDTTKKELLLGIDRL